MEQPCGGESGKKRPRRGRFSLSTTKVRQAPRSMSEAEAENHFVKLLRKSTAIAKTFLQPFRNLDYVGHAQNTVMISGQIDDR